MMRQIGLVLVMGVLVMAPRVGAEPPNSKRLEPIQWSIGTWQRTWTAEKDTDSAKKGDKLAKQWRFEWTPNKNAVLVTQVMKVNGKVVGQLDALFGWNANEQEITGNGYGTDGLTGGGWTLELGKEKFAIVAGGSSWDFSKKGKDLVVENNVGTKLVFERVSEK